MNRYLALFAVMLATPVAANACPPVQQLVAAPQVYAAPQAIVAAPVVYQPQVVQQIVAQPVSYAVAAPIVQQQIIVKQQRVRRHPVRRAAQIVLPPYGCR